MELTLTDEEKVILGNLIGNALDQAHDARGFGEETYLSFIVDSEGDPTIEECERAEELLASVAEKLGPKEDDSPRPSWLYPNG